MGILSKMAITQGNLHINAGSPLLTLFFENLEKQPCKQKSDLVREPLYPRFVFYLPHCSVRFIIKSG